MEVELMLGLGAVLVVVLCFACRKPKATEPSDVSTPAAPKPDSQKLAQVQSGYRSAAAKPVASSHREVVAPAGPDLEDDGLATFTISFGEPRNEHSQNTTPGRWVRPGEATEVAGCRITGGNFYFGGRLNGMHSFTEASLVDESFGIKRAPMEFSDDSLGYWPRFSSLSPDCRGAYLSWLASDRINPAIPLGYAFIYFYGLERRVLIDAQSPAGIGAQEYSVIAREVQRLLDVFGASRSFRTYARRFVEAIAILKPDLTPHDANGDDPVLFPNTAKLRIAKTVSAGKPVPADEALAWLYLSGFSPKTPARRCHAEFSELFKIRYASKFGEGMQVKPNKTKLKLSYQPANPTLATVLLNTQDLNDPTVLSGPAKKLDAIAVACSQELEAYSRYLGKKGASREDIAGLLSLPDDLLSARPPSVLNEFRNWADEAIAGSGGRVNFLDLWSCLNDPVPEKVGKKEASLIQTLAEKTGYGIAPDMRYHHTKPSSNGTVVLFAGGHREGFEPSPAYNEVAMTLRLGALVAKADGSIDEAEASILHNLVDRHASLSPTEKASLGAYLNWRLHDRDDMTGMKARLGALGEQEKTAISRVMINVALADGAVGLGEMTQMEKLYTALGLDKGLLSSDVHSTSTSKGFASKGRGTGTPDPSVAPAFELDESRLALHETETKDVQRLLGSIFVDSDDEGEAPAGDTGPPSVSSGDGLDAKHLELYEQMIANESWTRDALEGLCQPLGLMVDGALEAINDWAFDTVDAPVFDEDGDTIYVDLEIVQEIRGAQS